MHTTPAFELTPTPSVPRFSKAPRVRPITVKCTDHRRTRGLVEQKGTFTCVAGTVTRQVELYVRAKYTGNCGGKVGVWFEQGSATRGTWSVDDYTD